jgi:nitrite reductase/ring-hydroxylating ferredoxin subunit
MESRYTSVAFMEREREALWPAVWLLAGVADDVASPGRCFAFEHGCESLLVVNDAGALRAFHNVCQHRGHPLRPDGAGKVGALRCPYHGWTYGLDGRLRHVPDRETFASGAPEDELSLRPLGCATVSGLVFVHMSETREAPPRLELPGAARARTRTVALDRNWKLAAACDLGEYLFPNARIVARAGGSVVLRYRPDARDPGRSFVDIWTFGGVAFEADELLAGDGAGLERIDAEVDRVMATRGRPAG